MAVQPREWPIRIGALEPGRYAQAYPLVQVHWPAVALETWLDFARGFEGADAAMIGAADAAGYLYGVAAYRLRRDRMDRPGLDVEALLALGLVNTDLMALLLQAIERRAKAERCAAIRVGPRALGPSRTGRDGARSALAQAGYAREARWLVKSLGA